MKTKISKYKCNYYEIFRFSQSLSTAGKIRPAMIFNLHSPALLVSRDFRESYNVISSLVIAAL